MKTSLACGLAPLALLLSLPASAAESDGKGAFEAVATSDTSVWVVDTRTGQVRKCTQDFADQAPKCTAMSN